MQYFGWIPNLRGRLSFSAIGTSTIPYPVESKSRNEFRLIFQNRTLNDSAVPRFIRRILFEMKFSPFRILFLYMYKMMQMKNDSVFARLLFNSGDFYFIYLEDKRNETTDVILGKIYVISVIPVKGCDSFESIKEKIKDETSFEKLSNVLNSNSIISTEFNLKRNGIACFTDVNLMHVKIEDLKWTSTEKYSDFKHHAVSQLYYFLKDLCHQHQHHDSKADTLLPLVAIDPEINKNVMPVLADGVLKSLYRVVLKMRRTHSQSDYFCMLGLLAYISSFKRIISLEKDCMAISEKYSSDGDKDFLESVSAKARSIESSDEYNRKMFFSMPSLGSLTVSTVALIFAFTSLVVLIDTRLINSERLKGISFSSNYYDFVIFVLQNPLSLFIIVGFIYLLLFFWKSDRYQKSKTRFDIMRLAYGFGKQYLLAAFIIVLSLFFLWYGLKSLELLVLIDYLKAVWEYGV